MCARAVTGGQQAYVVYPVIEESEKDTGLKAAIKMYDELRGKVFPELKVGLLHGRMSAEEKDEIMRRFKGGEVQVLVATTVIEVGVDVANATVMVIEHAERFGLSQTAPAARTHRPGQRQVVLRADDRGQDQRRGAAAAGDDGRHLRRL